MSAIYRDDRADAAHRYVAVQNTLKHQPFTKVGSGRTPEMAVDALQNTPFPADGADPAPALLWHFSGGKSYKRVPKMLRLRVQDLDELLSQELIEAMDSLPQSDEYVAWLQKHGEGVLEPWDGSVGSGGLGKEWFESHIEDVSEREKHIEYGDDEDDHTPKEKALLRDSEALGKLAEEAWQAWQREDAVETIRCLRKMYTLETSRSEYDCFTEEWLDAMLTDLGRAIFERTP